MFNLWGIRKNILVLVLTPTILVSLALSTYFVIDRIEILESAHNTKGRIIVSSLSLVAESHTLTKNVHLQQKLSHFRDSDPDILAIAIIKHDNDFMIQSGNDLFIDQLRVDNYPKQFQVFLDGELSRMLMPVPTPDASELIYLSIIINRQSLILEIYHTLFMASIITLAMVIMSLYFSIHLSRSIGTPLQRITEELDSINKGNLDIKIHTPDIPELAQISKTINSLATSLLLSQENVQHTVDQATSDLTQTLETIEVQNIELDMARKQALQASRVKSEFLANISHEIRTPMNGVIGFTNLLLNTDINAVQKDYLLTIRKSANNLLSIIEDILDFSKIEAGKMTLDKLSFSMRDSVEEVITMLSPSAVKKNIELIPLIYTNVPEQQLGDPVRVKQIFTNLISNAIKFSEKGSIVVRVQLEDEQNESQIIRSTISDTGIGMTDEQLSKLFQPFSQVNQSINRHHSGTGLGLVICKKLVEQMGGEISVESKSNEGTSFSFTLRSTKLNATSEQLNQMINLSNHPVLLFDSHPMALLAMKQLLNGWKMKVYDFQSIEKLLSAAKNLSKNKVFNPLILLGHGENNLAFAEDIKKLKLLKHKAMYVIGHETEQFEIEKLLHLGASHYLEKPLTRKQLRKSFQEIGLISSTDNDYEDESEMRHHFSQLKILTVDDNPANLKLITIVLEEMSINVIQAYDGLSAVEICKEEIFDLIFMDIRMPGLDGIGASQKIKEDSLNQRTPIIALTAHAIAGEKEQLLSNGLEDYMTKPVSESQLRQIISKWTGQIAKEITKNGDNEQSNKSIEVLTEDDKTLITDESSSINWDVCLDIAGGRDTLAKEMLADLVAAIPGFRDQLMASDKNDQEEEFLSNVHKLHGFASYTGVPILKSLAGALENELKMNSTDSESEKLLETLLIELSNIEADSSSYL